MKPIFEIVSPDAVEQEVTQKDQFNTDEVSLAETLVRESHQNSSDARLPGGASPVRIRIGVKEAGSADAEFWRPLLSLLHPHLKACGINEPSDYGRPRLLIIEDFGTTGLTGNPEAKDKSNFQDFWRRIGRSHKTGDKGGSWGLGKIVFPASSSIRTFFGLTVRHDDQARRRLLMGQSVLRHHSIGEMDFHPVGYFAETNARNFRVPVTDVKFVDAFCEAAGVTRKQEPGLSIAIPFAHAEIDPTRMIPYVVRNYFFPILTGKLEVEVCDEKVTATSIEELGRQHGGSELSNGHLFQFIRAIHDAREKLPAATLRAGWTHLSLESAIDEKTLIELRKSYANGDLIHVRAPISLKPRSGPAENGSFDLFLRAAAEGVRGVPLFVRGAITVPNEAQFFPSRQVFAALVASSGPVASFLRDAENPAHTRWNGRAERLSENWKAASARLTQIRGSLRSLYELLAQTVERVDKDFLIDVLSVKGPTRSIISGKSPSGRTPPRPVPPIVANPRVFVVGRTKNGFSVRKGPNALPEQFPLRIEIAAAYDLLRGDPFKKHSAYDFDFSQPVDLSISCVGASCTAKSANELIIDAETEDFEVHVEGFDVSRDLKVKATKVAP